MAVKEEEEEEDKDETWESRGRSLHVGAPLLGSKISYMFDLFSTHFVCWFSVLSKTTRIGTINNQHYISSYATHSAVR